MRDLLFQIIGIAIIIIVYLGITALLQNRMLCPQAECIQEKSMDLPLSRSTVLIDEDILEEAINSSDWAEYRNHHIKAREGFGEQFASRVNRNGLAGIISQMNHSLFEYQDNSLELKSRKNGFVLVPTWVLYEFNQYLPYDQ